MGFPQLCLLHNGRDRTSPLLFWGRLGQSDKLCRPSVISRCPETPRDLRLALDSHYVTTYSFPLLDGGQDLGHDILGSLYGIPKTSSTTNKAEVVLFCRRHAESKERQLLDGIFSIPFLLFCSPKLASLPWRSMNLLQKSQMTVKNRNIFYSRRKDIQRKFA